MGQVALDASEQQAHDQVECIEKNKANARIF